MSNIDKCLNCGKRKCDNCLGERYTHNRKRSIHKLDLFTEEILETYPSIAEAARIMDIPVHQIQRALKIEGQPAGGFYWQYAHSKDEVKPGV